MNKGRWTIVIPTIREEKICLFLESWKEEFLGERVVVIEDNPTVSFKLPKWVEHYGWSDIEKDLGRNSWIIPRRTDAIRSYGFLKATQQKTDFILTIDDDCLPEKKYQGKFLIHMSDNLDKKWPCDFWWNTVEGFFPRGFPYKIRNKYQETIVHHGLWSNIPDLDAKTQRKYPRIRTKSAANVYSVPYGKFFPMCGMNLAFKPKVIPSMYFLLMGSDVKMNSWPYDRFGDIWTGLFVKKIADHLGYTISSGFPSVRHIQASNIQENYKKEKNGLLANEIVWRKVQEIQLTKKGISECYLEIAEKINLDGEYWSKLRRAMEIWTELCIQ